MSKIFSSLASALALIAAPLSAQSDVEKPIHTKSLVESVLNPNPGFDPAESFRELKERVYIGNHRDMPAITTFCLKQEFEDAAGINRCIANNMQPPKDPEDSLVRFNVWGSKLEINWNVYFKDKLDALEGQLFIYSAKANTLKN